MTTFTTSITIYALTEDFYPMLYLFKNELSTAPTDFSTLTYANPSNYTVKLGTDFS